MARLKGSIAKRLAFWFLILTAVTAVVVGSLMLSSFEEAYRKTLITNLNGLADKKMDQINTYFFERFQDLEVLADTPMISAAMQGFQSAYGDHGPASRAYKEAEGLYHVQLREYLRRTGYYDLFLINPDGDIVYSVIKEDDFATNLNSGPYRDSGLAEVTRHVLEQVTTGQTFFDHYAPSDEHAAFIATPIIKDGVLLGVLALQLDTKAVTTVVTDQAGMGESGEAVAVMSSAGDLVLTVPTRVNPDASFQETVSTNGVMGAALQRALKGAAGSGFLSDGGREFFAVWRYLPNLNWALLTRVNVDEGMQPIYEARKQLFGLGIVGTLLLIIFAFLMARTITRPLAELTDIAHEIASGKFDHKASISSDDEVGVLATALNTMSSRLQASINELDQNNLELESRVAERTADLENANQDLSLLAAVVKATSEGVVITNKDGLIVDVNPAYCEITGYTREDLIGKNPNINKSGVHDRDFYRDMWAAVNAGGRWSGEIWDKKKDGTVYPKLLTINALKNDQSEVCNYVGIFTDISEIKAVEKKLETLAYFDPLTGLPNRSLYHDRLRQAFSAAQRGGDKVALMLLDLDRFKYVNDTLGHQAGDELLKMVAERVVGRVRETDTVARLGGDEFTVVLPSIKDLNGIGHIAQGIVDLLAKPFSLNGQDVYVGVSIGISIYPDDALDGETLNKNADMAMYKAKESGRGRYHFYQSEMHEQAQKRMTLERSLRRALEHEEFRVFYQPKVNIREHKIIGMEALVRWFDPDKGMISPADFIPIAEENGMIIFIDQLVLRAACSQLRLWLDAGWDLRVAVNLSALQFRQSDLVEIVGGVLKEYDLSPGSLELEITESAIMDDPNAAIALIQGLRDLGVYLSIDDFGTGYSSLAYLKKFPINTLKIDQAFVRDLTWDSDDAAIVRSVIALSEGLSLNVVAEGIETEEQRAFLLEHNCANGQGYYYSKPLPADEFEALLKTGLK